MQEVESCDVCERPTDSKHFNCPPRMSDGRHFTDYAPKCTNFRNAFMIEDKNGDYKFPPANSFDFRQYLIHNGEKIMDMNRENAFQRNMCGPCSIDPSTMLPEQTKVVCNENTCKVTLNNSQGLGQGRLYETKGQKPSVFDERRQAKIPKNCCTSMMDNNNFYPLDNKIKDEYGRIAIPSGGSPLHISDRT